MADYGLTKKGFERKRLPAILEEINGKFKSNFGENFNTSPETPDGQVNGIYSESATNLWELAEAVYNSFDPNAATGAALSRLVEINKIQRQKATTSRVQLTLSGVAGTLIPKGSIASTGETQFVTENNITLDSNGNGSVFASATETGEIIALAGTVNKIETPITGWNSVNNLVNAIVGRDVESDIELRARRSRSTAIDAKSSVDALYSKVANVDGVTHLAVLENDTNAVNADGLPPHSFSVIVAGGNEQQIVDAIWNKKPAGIQSHGSSELAVYDSQGISHQIKYSRPTEIDIYIIVNITSFQGYPVTGDDDIKKAIVSYANGEMIEGRGFTLSANVIHSELYTPINSIPKHTVDSLFIAKTAAPTVANDIVIGATEIAKFTEANILVNNTAA